MDQIDKLPTSELFTPDAPIDKLPIQVSYLPWCTHW